MLNKSIGISHDTHQRLINLKLKGDTFDNVIERLLDMEDKYNPHDDIIYEYEYIYGDESRVFLVMFGDTVKIKYYSQLYNRFESNIKAWGSKSPIPEDKLDSFIKFIVNEANLVILFEMDKELVQDDIHIKRVG